MKPPPSVDHEGTMSLVGSARTVDMEAGGATLIAPASRASGLDAVRVATSTMTFCPLKNSGDR